ncbi:MAG: hypothetical protein ABIH55_01630 [Nanoarchaeota archaeon]
MPKSRKKLPKSSTRTYLTLTYKQLEMIDELVESGEFGSKRAPALQNLVMEFVRDWRRKRKS